MVFGLFFQWRVPGAMKLCIFEVLIRLHGRLLPLLLLATRLKFACLGIEDVSTFLYLLLLIDG